MPVTIRNIVKDSAGNNISGAGITLTLVTISGGVATSSQGFYEIVNATTVDDYSINQQGNVTTNSGGVWSVSVPGNTEIRNGSGVYNTTHWKIEEAYGGTTRTYYLKVNQTDSATYWVGTFLDQTPALTPETNLEALSNVSIADIQNGDYLRYRTSTSEWYNSSV